jgi:hypothetical protein
MALTARALMGVLGLAVLLGAAQAPARDAAAAEGKGKAMAEMPITQALEQATPKLMKIEGVVGTAQGLCEGAPCIKIYVAKKTPELLAQIPATIAGHPVAVEETGPFKALER